MDESLLRLDTTLLSMNKACARQLHNSPSLPCLPRAPLGIITQRHGTIVPAIGMVKQCSRPLAIEPHAGNEALRMYRASRLSHLRLAEAATGEFRLQAASNGRSSFARKAALRGRLGCTISAYRPPKPASTSSETPAGMIQRSLPHSKVIDSASSCFQPQIRNKTT